MKKATNIATLIIFLIFNTAYIHAEENTDLAKQLANPVASLISVPFQYNYDENFGFRDEGSRHLLNIQPVIPFSISDDWNIISRTILPLVDQKDIFGLSETGVGDTIQSFFFSPKEPTSGGLIWGIGPAFLFPTASDDELGGEKWGGGPTFVGLKQEGHWTYGVLSNHIWSFAGTENRNDINNTFVQPFLSYITDGKTTFTINSESTYDWENDHWTAPINVIIAHLFTIGNQPFQIGAGPRYWVETPDGGPEDWGIRAMFTLLFPK